MPWKDLRMGLDVKRVLSMLVLATAAAVVVSLGSSAVAGSGTSCSPRATQYEGCESAIAQLLRDPSGLTPRRIGSVVFTNTGTAVNYDVTLRDALPNTGYVLIPNGGHEHGNILTDANGDGRGSTSISCPFFLYRETTEFWLLVLSGGPPYDSARTRVVTLPPC